MYLYTGTAPRAYMDYVDESTGRMLEAQPGVQYELHATWDKLPVPPADGFWEAAEPAVEAEAPVPAAAEAPPKGQRPAKTSA